MIFEGRDRIKSSYFMHGEPLPLDLADLNEDLDEDLMAQNGGAYFPLSLSLLIPHSILAQQG